jgi:hypothetical protein
MPADKPTRAIHQYSFHRRLHTPFLNFIDMIAGATPRMGCAGRTLQDDLYIGVVRMRRSD